MYINYSKNTTADEEGKIFLRIYNSILSCYKINIFNNIQLIIVMVLLSLGLDFHNHIIVIFTHLRF